MSESDDIAERLARRGRESWWGTSAPEVRAHWLRRAREDLAFLAAQAQPGEAVPLPEFDPAPEGALWSAEEWVYRFRTSPLEDQILIANRVRDAQDVAWECVGTFHGCHRDQIAQLERRVADLRRSLVDALDQTDAYIDGQPEPANRIARFTTRIREEACL